MGVSSHVLAHGAADLVAVDLGQHDVEQHEVGRGRERQFRPASPSAAVSTSQPRGNEGVLQAAQQRRLVFDNQDRLPFSAPTADRAATRRTCCPRRAGSPHSPTRRAPRTMKSTMLSPRPHAARFARQAPVHLVEAAEDSSCARAGRCRCRCPRPRIPRGRSGRTRAARCASRRAVYFQALSSRFSSTVTRASSSARTAAAGPGLTSTSKRQSGPRSRPRAFQHGGRPLRSGVVFAKSNLRRLRSMREKVRKLSIRRLRRRFSRGDHFEVLARGLFVRALVFEQGFDQQPHGGERRLQLVRDGGDEVGLQAAPGATGGGGPGRRRARPGPPPRWPAARSRGSARWPGGRNAPADERIGDAPAGEARADGGPAGRRMFARAGRRRRSLAAPVRLRMAASTVAVRKRAMARPEGLPSFQSRAGRRARGRRSGRARGWASRNCAARRSAAWWKAGAGNSSIRKRRCGPGIGSVW